MAKRSMEATGSKSGSAQQITWSFINTNIGHFENCGIDNTDTQAARGSRVLDVACGNGRHSLIFASKGLNVLGIDLSAFLIGEARKNW